MRLTNRSVRTWAACCALVLSLASASAAQTTEPLIQATAATELYTLACAACHGADGRGLPQSRVGFATPLPDFTDCSFATREPAADWFAVAHDGGPARAFDRRMPAFGEALTAEQIDATLRRVREFCPDPAWPRGELNLPRPLVTEKAYPEDEAVVTTTIETSAASAVGNEFLYEHRLGARSQYEIVVPFTVRASETGDWTRGLGDIALAVKHVLFHRLASGTIVSATGEVVLPTGKETEGLGRGVTVLEPFVTIGQILPGNAFVHAQAGAELPVDTEKAEREAFWRAAAGRTFEQANFGRAWSPMVELLAARELERGAATQWDIVPQMQVTLSKRQHIMVNAGVRMPLTDRNVRNNQVIAYFLWDWFDGGLTDGWR